MKINKIPFSQKQLNDMFLYDAETGRLTWKVRQSSSFSQDKSRSAEWTAKRWNTLYSGKEVGCDRSYKRGGRGVFLLGKGYSVHRIIWFMVHGFEADQIDHINGDALDNRLQNLRSVSARENSKNRKVRFDNHTGIHGVHYDKKNQRFVARITTENGRVHLGCFCTLEAAAAARKLAERDYGYHPNHGRIEP